jgi:hypothetical protein
VIHTNDRMWRANWQASYKRIAPWDHPKSSLDLGAKAEGVEVGDGEVPSANAGKAEMAPDS